VPRCLLDIAIPLKNLWKKSTPPIFFNNNIPASPQPSSLSLDHWKPETSDSSRPSRWIPTHWHSNAKVHHPTRSYLVLEVFQWRKSRITQKSLKNTKKDCKGGTRCKTHTPKESTKYHLHKMRAGKEKNSNSISILLGKNDSSGCMLVTPYYRILWRWWFVKKQTNQQNILSDPLDPQTRKLTRSLLFMSMERHADAPEIWQLHQLKFVFHIHTPLSKCFFHARYFQAFSQISAPSTI